MPEFTTRKYDGDDQYSWAVFRSKDVKGKRGVIFYGEAKPAMSGMSRSSAQHQAKFLNSEEVLRGKT